MSPVHSLLGGGGGGEGCLLFLVRVGTCADELRLMGGGRGSTSAEESVEGRESASAARNASSAWAPPAIERIWHGPCEEGAY